jgi:hypothetical protein
MNVEAFHVATDIIVQMVEEAVAAERERIEGLAHKYTAANGIGWTVYPRQFIDAIRKPPREEK